MPEINFRRIFTNSPVIICPAGRCNIIRSEAVFAISPGLVIREVGEDLVLVPTVFKQDRPDAGLFTTSKTGKTILYKIDGKKTLNTIIEELAVKFTTSSGEIEKDVFDFISELKRKNIIFNVDQD